MQHQRHGKASDPPLPRKEPRLIRRRPIPRSRSKKDDAHAASQKHYYLKRRRQQNQAKREWAKMIGCPYCEKVVLRSEFLEHEKAHRTENPQLYEWIDQQFPNWKP